MPKEFIEQSNKELAAINLAYDKIKEIRAKVDTKRIINTIN